MTKPVSHLVPPPYIIVPPKSYRIAPPSGLGYIIVPSNNKPSDLPSKIFRSNRSLFENSHSKTNKESRERIHLSNEPPRCCGSLKAFPALFHLQEADRRSLVEMESHKKRITSHTSETTFLISKVTIIEKQLRLLTRLLNVKDLPILYINEQPILIAARLGDRRICQVIIDMGGDPGSKNKLNGFRPIHYAAKRGLMELVELFSTYEDQLEARTKAGDTPAMIAATFEKYEACEFLMKATTKNPNKNLRFYHIIPRALFWKINEVVSILAKRPELFELIDPVGNTTLHVASYVGGLNMFESLFAAGGKIKYKKTISNENVMHIACRQGHIDIVKKLLCDRNFLEERNINGDTPLRVAARHGHFEICVELINAYAIISGKSKWGENVLFLAIMSGCVELVRLFANYSELLIEFNDRQETPLDYAMASGVKVSDIIVDALSNMAFESLLQNGIDLRKEKRHYRLMATFIYWADLRACKILLDCGINRTITSEYGYNLLHVAVIAYCHADTRPVKAQLEYLSTFPELLEMQNSFEITPLELAISKGYQGAATVLREAGAVHAGMVKKEAIKVEEVTSETTIVAGPAVSSTIGVALVPKFGSQNDEKDMKREK